MVRIKIASFMAAAACTAILAVPQTASAQSTFIVPFDRLGLPGVDANGNPTGAFANPCTLEFVDVSGSSTISSTTSVNKSNVRTTTVSVSTKGTGAGWVDADLVLDGLQYGLFTGSTYVFSESQSFTIKQQNGTITDSMFVDKLSMKGVQSIDNWTIRARFRIKIGPDGSVQVTVDRMSEGVCKG